MRAIVLGLVLLASQAMAGSIFDDQNPTQNPIQSTPEPQKPQPEATPPQVTPSRPVAAARPRTPGRVPRQGLPTGPDPTVLEVAAQARQAFNRAKLLAADYFAKAQADVQAQLDGNPEYTAAKARAEALKTRLENIRLVGTPEQKLAASAEYSQAAMEEKRMRETRLRGAKRITRPRRWMRS